MIRVVVYLETGLVGWALANALGALANDLGVQVAGQAATREDLAGILSTAPEAVVLTDVTTLAREGFRLASDLRGNKGHAPIVAMFRKDQDFAAAEAIAAGVAAVLDMNTSPAQLDEALRTVHAGGTAHPRRLATLAAHGGGPPTDLLSQRELQVMEKLALGETNREIATLLQISVRTVDTHRGHVLKKLRLRNNADLTRYAVFHGMIQP